ncbi:hypothetical protein DSM43276_02067 [Mycobacteroides salmoniphilum]|nr:hypothetical protein DSM43276_02067 [Mycobacteroides salmoniphilum]
MGNLLLRPLRLWVMYLPQLAACYLLGLLGRNIVIELAAKYAWNNYLVVDLLMPFAGLARLGSIIAMFLVLRPAIPALATMPRISFRNVDIFANVVLPFFVIYLAWKMFQDDWLIYEQKVMWHRIGVHMTTGEETATLGNIPITNYIWVLIAGAFVLRLALNLKSVKSRLPAWFVFIRVYLDALWVFLVLSFSASKGVSFFLSPSTWFGERRIVVWFEDMRSELFSHFRPLEVLWSFAGDALHIIWGAAAVPLIWLAIAGIVYGSSDKASWRGVLRRLAGLQAAEAAANKLAPARDRVQRQVSGRLSEQTRSKAKDWLLSQFGSARPIIDSARLVLHGGLVVLSAYVLVYLCLSWLDMSDSFLTTQMQVGGYLTRGFAWILGPHPLSFWNGVAPILTAISGVLVASLRMCVVASVFAHCVERVEAESSALADNEVVDYPADPDELAPVNPVVAGP